MYQLIIRQTATEKAKDAFDWYEEQQLGLGNPFLDELRSCYEKIKTSPASYTKIKKNFRHILLKKFPYIVIYEIIGNDVVVYAVFHTSRNPQRKFQK